MKASGWISRGTQLALAILAACWLSVPSTVAYAAPPIVGAAEGRVLFSASSRYGGALSTDLWYDAGFLKLGGAFAVGAISEGAGKSSRVLTPVGLSLALLPAQDQSGPTALARGGVAAGAKKGGFTAGPWASCALGYRFALGEGASVRVGADMWILFGDGSGLFFAPYAGLGF